MNSLCGVVTLYHLDSLKSPYIHKTVPAKTAAARTTRVIRVYTQSVLYINNVQTRILPYSLSKKNKHFFSLAKFTGMYHFQDISFFLIRQIGHLLLLKNFVI